MSYIYRHREQLLRNARSLNHRGGKELFGVVIKSGYNLKTVTVQADFRKYVTKYKLHQRCSAKLQVHDPYQMGRVGDRVFIRACPKISTTKNYILRNFFIMSPRMNFSVDKFLIFEQEALVYNQKLQEEDIIEFKSI